MALALGLSKRSTPTEGGFCTWRPAVDGGACPWNLGCTNCDKVVLSGADLLYWRRKAEQRRSLAERAPSDEIADFLHATFELTARAIAGLESPGRSRPPRTVPRPGPAPSPGRLPADRERQLPGQ